MLPTRFGVECVSYRTAREKTFIETLLVGVGGRGSVIIG